MRAVHGDDDRHRRRWGIATLPLPPPPPPRDAPPTTLDEPEAWEPGLDDGELRRQVQSLDHEVRRLRVELDDRAATVAAMEASIAWRLTRPLRALRRLQLRARAPRVLSSTPARPSELLPSTIDVDTSRWLAVRLRAAAAALGTDSAPDERTPDDPVDTATACLRGAIDASTEPSEALAWLAYVAFLGRFPLDVELERMARRLRMDGVDSLLSELRHLLASFVAAGGRSDRGLAVISSMVVVDVGHTVTYDLHTGIQRVVKETVSRWLTDPTVVLAGFDHDGFHTMALAASERERIADWRSHVHQSGAATVRRLPERADASVLVPWRSTLVLPELVTEPDRCDAYRALARSGVLSRLGVVGFDTIPITMPEAVVDGMPGAFAAFLSVVKHATALSAISATTASEFDAFDAMVRSQGVRGPMIASHPLPSERPPVGTADLARARRLVAANSRSIVLVVGSHEPRKNHLRVMEAAERLWATGRRFDLVFAGGAAWGDADFVRAVGEAQAQARSVRVVRRVSEAELWACYELARFTVFPSIVEGFGLPIVESLACGTPVITSAHGSMAEAAAGGGALTVDPLDIDAMAAAMALLLDDDVALTALRSAAQQRRSTTWDDHARAVWNHLTGTGTGTGTD